ncbi:Vezatin [Frankliniella fusca]|uniref:Vezatin n=1 Tax=Frankliniella fusca TaxID=407009 RepID=A0AAE1LTG8_9NEOP|nr:Vezatin [Frankliniella fusca]
MVTRFLKESGIVQHIGKILAKLVDNEILSKLEARNLSYGERARLIQRDPVTCSQYFDQRFRALTKTWNSPHGPFQHHEKIHHYHRIEFQQRGSPHVHMLAWLKDAPTYDANDELSTIRVTEFIDSIISSSSNELHSDLKKLQTHQHSHTCKRGNQNTCRFKIPYFPMKTTQILKPLSDDYPEDHKNELRKKLKKIEDGKEDLASLEKNFEDFLSTLANPVKNVFSFQPSHRVKE